MHVAGRPVLFLSALAVLVAVALLCSDPAEPYPLAPEVVPMGDTAVAVYDTVLLHVSVRGEDIESLTWTVPYADTVLTTVTAEPALPVCWAPGDTGTRLVRVSAAGANGTVSDPAIIAVRVHLYAPVLQLTVDSAAPGVRDTVVFTADARDTNGTVMAWLWTVDADTVTHAGTGPELRLAWGNSECGPHRVRVQVLDDDSLVSAVCSVAVTVMLNAPWVQAMGDTTVAVNDTLALRAPGGDSPGGHVVAWVWELDSGAGRDTTGCDSLCRAWGRADTGQHTVTVRVVDDDSVESAADTFVVTVALFGPRVSVSGDTAVCVHDTAVVRAAGSDTNGPVVAYAWELDGGAAVDTTAAAELRLVWGLADSGAHVVRVWAVDDDSTASEPDTCIVTVLLCPPGVTAMDDTVVSINDTVIVRAAGSDPNGAVARYAWQVDGLLSDTTDSAALATVWGRNDTGQHTVRVRAIDDDSVVSAADTMRVTVALRPPSVAFEAESMVVAINDTLVLRVQGADSNGVVTRYLWSVGGGPWDTTVADTLPVVFGRADAGEVQVRVMVLDDDTVASAPDTMAITVLLAPPALAPVRDTILAAGDSLAITLDAADSNGTIVQYLWDLGADGWDDSGAAPGRVIRHAGVDTLAVVAGVRDDDTTLVTDTFVVAWNHAPHGVCLLSPRDTAFVWYTQQLRDGYAVTFRFDASDSNAPYDTLRYRLLLGPDTAALDTVYEGADTLFTLDTLDTGSYAWRLEVTDRQGARDDSAGTLVCVRQKRICFIGHSIITGDGGDGAHGGFRRAVLDSLAGRCAGRERVRPMGHMLSGNILPPRDDSCLARSGCMALEMFDSLRFNRWINADYWVIMLGVNSHYSWLEEDYCRRIMDTTHYRNPDGETYFLNGLPLPDSVPLGMPTRVQLTGFNTWLDAMADVRRNAGWKLYVVNACSTMSVDTVSNDTLFYDCLHPNQLGYDRLSQAIWAKMLSH